MYPRKSLDISFSELFYGMAMHFNPKLDKNRLIQNIQKEWSIKKHLLVTLSVRSGFDLWLQALSLPPGSQVIMTGITIPDMPKIVEQHKLEVVPIDLNMADLSIKKADLKAAITAKTKIIVVAHLFGATINLDPVFELLLDRPDILVVEDCAQAFTGTDGYCGHPSSALLMYSFGTIKTATAVGGAVLFVQSAKVYGILQAIQNSWPTMLGREYLKKLFKVLLLKMFLFRPLFSLLIYSFKLLKKDYDKIIIAQVRGFKGADLFKLIRRQAPIAMLALLEFRLRKFKTADFQARIDKLQQIKPLINKNAWVAGINNPSHTNWIFSIAARNPEEFLEKIRALNIDCTSNSTQLKAIAPASVYYKPEYARYMKTITYIPLLPAMPYSLLIKIAEAINEDANSICSLTDNNFSH